MTGFAYNRRISSGLPHSEIPGSKGILTSPGLIAEYHVLHRLLLPRHPPNALKALDLIQEKNVFVKTSSPGKSQPERASCRWFTARKHLNIFSIRSEDRIWLHVIDLERLFLVSA